MNNNKDSYNSCPLYEADDLKNAIETLQQGGLILYPTDTVWGIGCDATNADAVKRIYDLKKRADSKSMLVLVSSEAELERCVMTVPEAAVMLIDAAVNPLTIIYDRPVGMAENLVAEDGSLGIRITKEAFSNALCRRFRKPIVSTSANISNHKTPANFSQIEREIIEGVDYVVRYRQTDTSSKKSSDIIQVHDNGMIKVIR